MKLIANKEVRRPDLEYSDEMSYTIAIAGKGGTGKTTIAALIVHTA